jgi:hypothetical protein
MLILAKKQVVVDYMQDKVRDFTLNLNLLVDFTHNPIVKNHK